MEKNDINKISKYLNADFSEDNTLWLTSSITLRKTVGILGMSLPLLLVLFLYVSSGYSAPLHSISHYYYTRVSGIFVSVISLISIFLIIYKGKALKDLIISMIAGVAALLVVFFPTGNITDICCDLTKSYSVTMLPKNEFREMFHFIAAAIFLGCLSYMSIFIFTKSNKPKELRGEMKILRNRIYRVCGIMMILALAIIFFGGFLGLIPESAYQKNNITFWMETLAIENFGFSWLVKGETLFKDK